MDGQNNLNQYLNTEIVCTLAGLGCAEGNEYYKGPDCLESLKDLIKFLRSDDTTCEIRRQLGYSEVLQNDLVSILKSCTPKETEIFDIAIRLMVNLTQPAVLCFSEKIPDDKTGHHYYMELVTQLQAYKEAFTNKEVFEVIGREVGRILQLEWDDRQEEDYLLLERILLLLRNILHVPADPQAEKRTDDDASIHDQVLWNMHVNGLDDLLLYVASSPDERRWCMHVLEIVFLMFREQNAESLAKAGHGRSSSEKEEDANQLEILRTRELAEKKKNTMKYSGRFGGTFYVKGMKAIDRNNFIYHKPLSDAKNMTFDTDKARPRRRKAQMVAKEMDVERKSTLSIRLYLKEFSAKFLEHCYNPLLNTVRDNLLHKRSQENDESYFLWSMRFFMEFSRHNDFRVDYVGETMSVANFTYVLGIITTFYDSYSGNKELAVTWARRLHLALKAYKELIMYVKYMDSSKEENLKHISKIIKGNLFYVVEYREIFMMLLRKFDYSKQTKAYLRDLVETFHIFLKMLETYSEGKSHLLVQQKKKQRKKKKKRVQQAGSANLSPEEVEKKWQSLTADLSALLQGRAGEIPESTAPFDAASDIIMDEQRTIAISNVQNLLRRGQLGEAVALLRAARDVWPGEPFGGADIGAEDEFMCLFDIFRMDLPQVNVSNEVSHEDGVDIEDEIDAEEEEMEAMAVRETELDIMHEIKRLAHPAIMQPYWWLLQFYKENSVFTNHCIIKMMHRVAVDLKMPAMFFQLSLFSTFKRILYDPAASKFKEMVKFARFILAQFFALLPKNPVLLAEVVVWKSNMDCYEITEGYGSLREVKRGGCLWSFEDEQELIQLYEEYQDSEDLVENILEHTTNVTRTRRQVVNKLVAMHLVTDTKQLRKKPKKKGAWSEEENEQLRGLYEEHKDTAEDVVETIIECLGSTRTRRQVTIQLVRLGIVSVEDRKSLHKKKKKTRRKKHDIDDDPEDLENEGQGSEDEEGFDNVVTSSEESASESDDNGDDLASKAPLSAVVKRLVEIGLEEQVKWIQVRLRRTAEDRENEDEWEPVPLVTITEENEDALKNRLFKRALKKVGIVPPANEQETFWRIPSTLSPDQLREAAFQLDISGEEGNTELETTSAAADNQESESNSKNRARKEKLAALAAAHKNSASKTNSRRKNRTPGRDGQEARQRAKSWRKALDTATGGSDDDSSEDENLSTLLNKSPDMGELGNDGAHAQESGAKRNKRRIQTFENSDDEVLDGSTGTEAPTPRQDPNTELNKSDEDSDAEDEENKENIESRQVQKPKGRFTQFDDSDDEPLSVSANRSGSTGILNDDDGVGVSSYDSAAPHEVGRKRGREEEQSDHQDEDNDDEDEFALPLSHHKKARRIMVEDDDDDDDE